MHAVLRAAVCHADRSGDGTARLSLAPGLDDAGVYPGVTVTVSDSTDSDSETFTITVTAVEIMDLFLPLVLQSH